MKTTGLAFAFATLFAAGVALPAAAQTTAPRDTGNMAYPAPVPQGNIGTTQVGPRTPDTGNMAYPTPAPSGNVGTGTGARAPDTGNMAYPAPLPQGNIGTTPVR